MCFNPLQPLPSQLPFFCQAAIGHLEVTHQPQGGDHGQSHNAHGHKSHSSTAMNRVALAQHDLRVNNAQGYGGWWLGPFGRCFFGGGVVWKMCYCQLLSKHHNVCFFPWIWWFNLSNMSCYHSDAHEKSRSSVHAESLRSRPWALVQELVKTLVLSHSQRNVLWL